MNEYYEDPNELSTSNNDEVGYDEFNRLAQDLSRNKEVLQQLGRNDPLTKAVRLDFFDEDDEPGDDGFDAHDVDWATEGKFIANNTHLKLLTIASGRRRADRSIENCKQLYKAISQNRSIRHMTLDICGNSIDIEIIFEHILPFFEHNGSNLLSFRVLGTVGKRGATLLASALLHCKSLHRFEFESCDSEIDMISASKMVAALDMHINPTGIGWDPFNSDSELGGEEDWCITYGKRKDRFLEVTGHPLRNGDMFEILQPFFTRRQALHYLDLTNLDLVDERSTRLFMSALSKCTRLQKLDIHCNDVGDVTAGEIVASLNTHTNLSELSLDMSSDGEEWGVALGQLLVNPRMAKLTNLNLQCLRICDRGAASLGNALGRTKSLKTISLSEAESITLSGWTSLLAGISSNPNCALEELDLAGFFWGETIDFGDAGLAIVATSLVSNTKLKRLDVSANNQNPSITPAGWQNFFNILENSLCNNSSIESICTSNHTLHDVTYTIGSGPGDRALYSYLRMNGNDIKSEVVRQKIIQYYFLKDNSINMEEFVDMELGVLPHVIAWMGRDDIAFPLLYQTVKNTPWLFDSDSKAKLLGEKRKKKRHKAA